MRRRGSATRQEPTIGLEDFEAPKRDLRERSKRVNYSDDVEEAEEEVANPEEEEEEEEVAPKKRVVRSRKQPTKTTRKNAARTARKPRKVVESDEDMDDALTSSEEDLEEEEEENAEEISVHCDNEESVIVQEEDDVVELILACRVKKQEEEDDEESETKDQETVIEYYCKYKGKSYLHCEWVPRSELDEDIQTKNKLKRFHKLYDISYFEGVEEFFNPEFIEVERVIDHAFYNGADSYLVKWKGLQYCDSTWEYADKIPDKEKIEQYKKFNTIPPADQRRIPTRPAPNKFRKLEESPEFRDGNQLREYQLEGLNWLVFCWYQRRNSILADEMGLGKTVQTVATLEYLRAHESIRGPFIVVAPLSTVEHWRREFEEWTDMNVLVFHGNTESRNTMKDCEFYYRDPKRNTRVGTNLFKFNVLISTYEIVMAEASFLSKIPWQYLVVDEGHRLKNHTSKLSLVLKDFSAAHKLLLTGTPIQNNLTELFSLLQFLDPETFDDLDEFAEEYGNLNENGSERLEGLHKLISPYILRRLKEDVEKSIPPKEEIVVEVVPTTIQKAYEQAIFKRNREFLTRGVSKAQNVPKLNNVLMELRKVCNHPFLISGAEENITRGMSESEVNEALIKSSSKMILVDKLLKKLREGGHKVLIFSQMVLVLNILEDYMRYRGFPYVRLDGTIKGSIRQQAIDRFNNPNIDTFVFLVSTKAGGVGINLTSADTVIIYDSDWNPQNDLQAQARCHRIGQTKEVKIYRLLTKNTKEKEIFERASMKLGLDRAVLSSNNEFVQSSSAKGGTQNKPTLDKEEIELLLRHGAYSAFKIDDTEEQKMLMDEDIDTIMERTATIVRYDSQSAASETPGLSNFSKATFCFSEDMEWQNLLPREKTASGLLPILSEEGSLETEEQKEEFMNDVKALVDSKLIDIEKFRYQPDEELATLLTQMIYARLLESEHQQKAKEWLAILEQPRLRNGATRDGESDEDDNRDSSSKKKTGGWYKAERQRFQKTLLELGWGKWDRIRESKLHTHTIQEIHSMAENFVSQLAKYCENEKDVEFLNMLIESTSVESDVNTDDAPTLKIEPTNGSAKAAEHIKIHLPKEDLANSSIEIIKVAQQGARVSKKKKAKTSSSKISTTNKVIRYYELSDTDKEKDVLVMAAPGFSGEFFIRLSLQSGYRVSKNFEVHGVHPVLEDKEWIDQAKRGAKGWVKKLKFNLCLTKIIDSFHGDLTEDNIPKVGIKAPADWWDKECDKDLMLGFGIHGYGRFDEMKEDSELCFKTKYEDHLSKAKSRKEKKDAGSWPAISAINKRANKLMELLTKEKDISIMTMLKGVSDEATTDDLAFDDAEIIIPTTVVESWSKREKADIQRALLNFGLAPQETTAEPNYPKLISQASLRKTESAVKTYVNHLLKVAKIMTKTDDGEDEEESESKKTNKPNSDDLAPGTAKKLLQRIEIMNNLYMHVYPNWEECKDKFKYLKASGSGLPKWWKSNQHDRELVRGIKKHGFEFKKLFADKDLKFGKTESPREGLLFARLEEIISLCKKISVLGSPTKSKGAWNFTPKKSHVTLKSPPLTSEKKSKRKVKRQTTLELKPVEDESDPIEETSDKETEKVQDESKQPSQETASVSQPKDEMEEEDVLKKKIPKKSSKQPTDAKETEKKSGTKRKNGEQGSSDEDDHHTPRKGQSDYEPNDKKRKVNNSPSPSEHKYSPHHRGDHHRDHRDYHHNDRNERSDRRDSRDGRDSRDRRDSRDGRDSYRERDYRDSRDNHHSRDHRDHGSSSSGSSSHHHHR